MNNINTKEYLGLLKEFVSIKSVSTDIAFKDDLIKCSDWLQTLLKKSGLETKVIKGFGNPIVLAKTKPKKDLETILIYGHYDVQPASKSDGWKTEPFKLTEISKRLYGRGVSDNKGQILMHIYSISKLLKENLLGYNIIFLIEGDEESGSGKLKDFIKKYRKELKCDCIVISDGELGSGNAPALEASFRGVSNVEIRVKTAKDDMHSGLFGGAVPNGAEELAKLLSKIHSKDKVVAVPNFYTKLDIESKDKTNTNALKKITGTKIIFAESFSDYENKTGLMPTIEVTTISSGYQGEGFRNSVPAKAVAKINIRSAPNQDPDELTKKLKKFLFDNKPEYLDLEFLENESTFGAELDLENKFASKAKELLVKIFKKDLKIKHSGGTLPIVNDFKEILQTKQVMIPLANEDCGMHSASENLRIDVLEKGLEFSYKFLGK